MVVTFTASTKSAGAPEIEAGVYPADFDGVKEDFIENSQYGNGDIFAWSFTVYDPGRPGPRAGHDQPQPQHQEQDHPDRLRWLKAILTKSEYAQFEAGEDIDAGALLGRRVQVQIEIKDSGWPKVVNVLPAAKG